MRKRRGVCLVLCLVPLLLAAPSAHAVVDVVFGKKIDRLQKLVDRLYGRGRINVQTDYIGARTGNPDPWFWADRRFSALLLREHTPYSSRNVLCWYMESGVKPAFPGGGIVFSGSDRRGQTALVVFDRPLTKFGFMLNPNGPRDGQNAPEPELFFTNRFFNDIGPDGTGAIHEPHDGDVQAIVFDVSRWTAPNTWLVCFEDRDSGADPKLHGPGRDFGDDDGDCVSGDDEPDAARGGAHDDRDPCGDPVSRGRKTDNDFDDMVFEVRALGATPAIALSFGELKLRYR